MKKLLVTVMVLVSLFIFISASFADVFVNGYSRRDGTYVQPHWRSNPDGNQFNNWSTRGNINPYTGQEGTRDPYRNQLPNYNRDFNSDTNPYGNRGTFGNPYLNQIR